MSAAVRFVLVRPLNSLNIGAVARAMANFGLDDLVAVAPTARRWREARSAIYAARVRDRTVETLDEALDGCGVVLGTASAHDRLQRQTVVTLPALGRWLAKRRGSKVAVLLGSERGGLTNEDLSRCHAVLRIPTAPDAPSMNLGQAAALLAYALFKLESSVAEPALAPAGREAVDRLVETALLAMEKVKDNARVPEAERRRRLRLRVQRWRMKDVDAAWLTGLLRKLSR